MKLLLDDSIERQKAPSTRRCIKTLLAPPAAIHRRRVRKYPVPEGALRLVALGDGLGSGVVRKHPAPEGALRLRPVVPAPTLPCIR